MTRDQVKAALEQWFIMARSGKTLSARETASLSAADAAEASTDIFLGLLKQHAPKQVVAPAPAPAKQDDLFA